MTRLSNVLRALALLACLALPWQAGAAGYPERPIKIIVPFPAGATMDYSVRLIAQHLGDLWGKPVVVENKTGGAGVIGTLAGAKADPDGYTITAIANSFAANPTLRKDLPYDTFKDFAPVSLIGNTPLVLVAHPSLPVNSLAELIALAKKQPGQISYGAAQGASPHLAMAWLESVAGIKLLLVPYRGQAQAQTDLLAGQVKLVFGNVPDVLQYIKAGTLKPLGIASAKRSTLASEIPTLAEGGYPGPEWDSWYGFIAPAGTPKEIVEKFSAGVQEVLKQPDVKAQLTKAGLVPSGTPPAQFSAFLRDTADNYAKIIKAAGIHTE